MRHFFSLYQALGPEQLPPSYLLNAPLYHFITPREHHPLNFHYVVKYSESISYDKFAA
jgi:hypothetical protein